MVTDRQEECFVQTQSESADFSNRSAFSHRVFESLTDETRKRAFTMAFQLTRNRSEAEDLVQTTYVKAWRGFDSYTPGRPFLNWLLRIMQHAYLDSRRRHDIVKTAEPIHATINASSGDVQELPIPDTRPSPEHELLSDEFRAKFYEALNQLPEVYRTAIQLCDIEELSYYEIAEVQQTTVGTVRSRIHRGRKMLREAVIRTGYHRSF